MIATVTAMMPNVIFASLRGGRFTVSELDRRGSCAVALQ
jgi:hypothetical protein